MKPIIFSLKSNKKVAKKLCEQFNYELGRISITHFADGEVMVKTLSDVKDKDVVIIESTFKKAHEILFELLLLIDSIKRAGSKSIKLFIPYFGYSRQERVMWVNEPISCKVVADLLETAHYDELYSLDLHHPIIKTFFTKPIEDIPTTELFTEYYLNYINSHNIKAEDVVVVSPDHGSNNRAERLSEAIRGSSFIILDKVRPAVNRAEHLETENDVNDKVCIIIDDIIDTGGTLVSSANLLYSKGARSVLVGVSHGIFSGNCHQKLKKANVIDIAITNTIERQESNDISILDISPLINQRIK